MIPGRPLLHCAATQNVRARLELREREAIGALRFEPRANHYRFIGLEVTRAGSLLVSGLAIGREHGRVDHVIFDRVWMHGTPQDETMRASDLTAMSHVAVGDAFFRDFVSIV